MLFFEVVLDAMRYCTRDCLCEECCLWCPGPESNRYAPMKEAADFKSDVSTNFTTRAALAIVKQKGLVMSIDEA